MALIMLMLSLGEAAKKGISSRKLTGGLEENCEASERDCDCEAERRSGGEKDCFEYSPVLFEE